jgi:hypothetical protein
MKWTLTNKKNFIWGDCLKPKQQTKSVMGLVRLGLHHLTFLHPTLPPTPQRYPIRENPSIFYVHQFNVLSTRNSKNSIVNRWYYQLDQAMYSCKNWIRNLFNCNYLSNPWTEPNLLCFERLNRLMHQVCPLSKKVKSWTNKTRVLLRPCNLVGQKSKIISCTALR